jgi:anaerobic selenocysteine-containing dehydrogenase
MSESQATQRIHGYCALCRSHCGCISVVEDGQLVAVEPDPSHPTGQALCAKGRAVPELVYHPERLLYPMRRTRPKGDPDPGWQRISWDEALDLTATTLRRLADAYGPETVAFGVTTPAGTAISDARPWIDRLLQTFGSPNNCNANELCFWHTSFATQCTFGVRLPPPELHNTGCMLFWGHNPSTAWLSLATDAVAAQARGARVIVVDPRRAGLAARADLWLRGRPGSDGALALGIAGVMIAEGWFDQDFIRDWTNGPLLVRSDTKRLLTERDLSPHGSPERYFAWDQGAQRPVLYDPATGSYDPPRPDLALFGQYQIATVSGAVECRPAFDLYAALCQRYTPDVVETITWVPRDQVRQAAQLLFVSRPVSYYAWTGVDQHTNATQTCRAMALLYALTGSFDAPGGNVLCAKVPTPDLSGREYLSPAQRAKALGFQTRPLGPPQSGWVTSDDLYRAILEGTPYAVRGLVGFGANLLISHADPDRASAALKALQFCVYADLFLTPTAALADVVLPVATAWEREALKIGFDVNQEGESLVQWRAPVIAPRGEARSDTWIVFELARRLGLGEHFWGGDITAAYRQMLAPSNLTLAALQQAPTGLRVPLTTRYRKYADQVNGTPGGFATPSRKIEIYAQRLLDHGYPPLPEYVEPAVGPVAQPDLAAHYPLILTCAKLPQFCHSQHRALPSLRRLVPDPEVELHPTTAAERGIQPGDWVVIATPHGRMQARARFRPHLDPRVVYAQHGWWQACTALGLPSYDPHSAEGANYNGLISHEVMDPVSGAAPHRSYLCQISKVSTAS